MQPCGFQLLLTQPAPKEVTAGMWQRIQLVTDRAMTACAGFLAWMDHVAVYGASEVAQETSALIYGINGLDLTC